MNDEKNTIISEDNEKEISVSPENAVVFSNDQILEKVHQIDTNTNDIEDINHEIDIINENIDGLASGGPRDIYDNKEAIIAGNPATGIYLAMDNGHIYYWMKDGTTVNDLGVYQATEIADESITPEKTSFIKTDNLVYYNRPAKNGYSVGGSGNNFTLNKNYNRYCAMYEIESDTEYTLDFKPFSENSINYFKIGSSTKTVEELKIMLQTYNFNLDGAIHTEQYNPRYYTTGVNDKTIIIQFSNDTPIEYAGLFKGHIDNKKYSSYTDCLDKLGFSVYNKKETENKIFDLIDGNGVIEFCKNDLFIIGSIKADGSLLTSNYYKRTKDFIDTKILNAKSTEPYHFGVCRYDLNGTFIDRQLEFTNYTFDHSVYKYKIIIFHRNQGNYEMNNINVEDILSLNKADFITHNELNQNTYTILDNKLTIKMNKARYVFKKVTNSSIHVDTYRLYSGDLLKDNNLFANMWNNSDAEGPIKIQGEEDFVGGYHGDEIATYLKILIDGVEITTLTETKVIDNEFKNITIICKSDVYHCNTSAKADVIAFKRIKKLVFEGNKVTVANDYTVNDNDGFRIESAATMLFQCYKNDNNGDKLINYVDTDNDLNLYPVTDSASQMPKHGMKEAYIYTTVGTIKIKVNKVNDGYNDATYNSYIQDFTDQHRIKPYFLHTNFNVVKDQKLLSEFEWIIE